MSYLRQYSPLPGLGEPPGDVRPRLVFVPGIMGSALYDSRSGELLWGRNGMLGWAPRMQQWVQEMSQGDGISNPGNVVPRGFTSMYFPLRTMAQIAAVATMSPIGPLAVHAAVRQFGLHDIVVKPYDDALQFFETQLGKGYVLAFPYDWRLSNDHNAALLKRAIEERWGPTLDNPARPLTIVAHSMGGLISRYYIERLGGASAVRNLVTVGTPHAGSPEALLIPTNLPSLARYLLPLEVVGWISSLPLLPVSPFAIAMPLLNQFVNGFLRELQTMTLHFSSIFQMLPGFPFVHASAADPVAEPLAATLDAFKRAMCADAAVRGRRQVCTRPLAELGRFAELLRAGSGALPSRVSYYPIVSHTQPTVVRCNRLPGGGLAGVSAACGDATVPARSAALPFAANVRNRYISTTWSHSDMLRDPRVLQACLNVARGSTAAVPGMSETVPLCIPAAPPRVLQTLRAVRVPA